MNLVRDHSNLSLLNARNACKIAEAEYIKNPRDADNLTRWGGALIKMYEEKDQVSIKDAISKLQEALSLDPCHHEALWCLGEALETMAPNIINNGKAITDCTEKAVVCYQRASDLDPSNEIYRKSLEWAIEGLNALYEIDQESTATTKSSPSSGTKASPELKYGLDHQSTRTTESSPSSGIKELRDELKLMRENQERTNLIMTNMRENQERTNLLMANMLSFIQNRFSGEDVNAIIQAARQIEGLDGVLDTFDGMSL